MRMNSKFIEVIRDGRDVCVSMQQIATRQSWAYRSRRKQICLWEKAIRKGMELKEQIADSKRYLTIRYEDLKADPCGGIKKIFSFAQIADEDKIVNQVREVTDIDKIDSKGIGKPVWTGNVGSWKQYFTIKDKKLFKQTAKALLEQIGYEWDES